jgi:hypothetical protein
VYLWPEIDIRHDIDFRREIDIRRKMDIGSAGMLQTKLYYTDLLGAPPIQPPIVPEIDIRREIHIRREIDIRPLNRQSSTTRTPHRGRD